MIVPCPVVTVICPPVPVDDAVESPALMVTSPPAPVSPVPTTTSMAPPAPAVASLQKRRQILGGVTRAQGDSTRDASCLAGVPALMAAPSAVEMKIIPLDPLVAIRKSQ